MKKRLSMTVVAGVLMAAMLPGITLGAAAGGPEVTGAAASAEPVSMAKWNSPDFDMATGTWSPGPRPT